MRMTPERLEQEIAAMKAKVEQNRKRHSVELVEAKRECKRALAFARKAHQGQTRKYTGEPYIEHPIEVANILIKHGIFDERTIMVALLHDVLEDTDTHPNELAVAFNLQIQRDVEALTKPKNHKNRADRIAAATKNQLIAAPCVMMVKIADIISNITDVALHDPTFASLYLEEKKHTLYEFGCSAVGRNNRSIRELLSSAHNALGEAMNQLALTTLAEENQRQADDADFHAQVAAIVHQQQIDELAEIALF